MFDDETREWPPEVRDACQLFVQGHLIESPPLFFFGVPEYPIWETTANAEPDADGGALIEIHPEDRPPYGMITSQTCDIDEQRKIPRQPFIQVCPVYRLPEDYDAGQTGHLGKDRVGHLMMLDAATLPAGLWVADFRLEAPLEKGILVGRRPIESFQTKERYRLLAQRLAFRRSRPALANVINDSIIESIREWRTGLDKADMDRAWKPVHRVLLSIQGDLLQPTAVQVIVATEGEPLPSEGKALWNAWWDQARTVAADHEFSLLGTRFTTMKRLSAAEYLEMVPLDMTYLAD